MEIPSAVLEKIKCSKCGVYLSRGPVYMQHDGAALCGRCFTPELPATRNTQYEAVAPLLRFPCKYSELGCGDTVPYVQEDEVIAHEEVCAHRQWVCPVLGSALCDWLGPRANLLQHCQDRHPDRVLDNPCHLEHDITRSSDRTFLLRAFQLLFLLHTKICISSAKIYHSIRHIGDSDSASKFKFTVNIKRGERCLSLPGDVAPQGCLAIQEDTSLVLDIKSFLSVLNGFDGASFTVEVKRRIHEVVNVCVICGVQGALLVYRDDGDWRCECCAPVRRTCNVPGCCYKDIDMKCVKHELCFCEQLTQCRVCREAVARGSLSVHRGSACKAVCNVGSTWRATRTRLFRRRCLVSSAAGTAVCYYRSDDTMFDLNVYIPVSSERLREFRCTVRVTQSATGQVRTYTPDTLYDKEEDWYIKVEKKEFPTWDCIFDVLVDITKVDT